MPEIYDGAWKLFSYDPLTGRSVWYITEDDRTHWRTDYPVEPLIRQNAEAHAEASKKFGEISRVASVPINVWQQSGMQEAQRQGDHKFMARWMNDSDNAAWRTRSGSV